MSGNDRIVKVNITKGSRGVQSANFATPLFLADESDKKGSGVVQAYTSLTGVNEVYDDTDAVAIAARAHFIQPLASGVFKVGFWDSDTDTAPEALNSIVDVDNQWYGLTVNDITERSEFADIAQWCELNKKFLFTVDNLTEMFDSSDTTSIAGRINAVGVSKACCIYNEVARTNGTPASYIDVGFASHILGKVIGSYTAEFKNVNGAIADNITETNRLNIYGKNALTYTELYGRDVIENSRVLDGTAYDPSTGVGGEWIDIEIGVDWIESRMQEAVASLIMFSEKIAYTDNGIGLIVSEVERILNIGVQRGLIDTFDVSAEPALDQSVEDRNARKYNGITWEARLAGAVHSTVINGTVEV
jgi:hypothetical protein